MAYIGNQTTTSFSSMAKQSITGNGGTGYTLDHAVANAQEIEVFVNNVRQEPGVAYTVSGTTLTMTGNVASSDDFYVVYQGLAVQTSVPGDNTVTTAMLQDNAATAAKVDSTLHLSTIKDSSGAETALLIRSTGIVSHGKIPHLKVGMNADLGMGGSNDYIRYNSFDAAHVFDGEDNMNGFSTSNSKYTIPANCNGLWHISAGLLTSTSNANQLAINVNGTREDAIGSDAGNSNQNQGAIVKRLAAGDEIQIYAFYASNITTESNKYHTWWEMTYLG